MEIDELRAARDRRPFVPFDIRTADGGRARVGHPEALSFPLGGPPMVSVVLPSGGVLFLVAATITSLDIPAPE
jgi:hypothetical protein